MDRRFCATLDRDCGNALGYPDHDSPDAGVVITKAGRNKTRMQAIGGDTGSLKTARQLTSK